MTTRFTKYMISTKKLKQTNHLSKMPWEMIEGSSGKHITKPIILQIDSNIFKKTQKNIKYF